MSNFIKNIHPIEFSIVSFILFIFSFMIFSAFSPYIISHYQSKIIAENNNIEIFKENIENNKLLISLHNKNEIKLSFRRIYNLNDNIQFLNKKIKTAEDEILNSIQNKHFVYKITERRTTYSTSLFDDYCDPIIDIFCY